MSDELNSYLTHKWRATLITRINITFIQSNPGFVLLLALYYLYKYLPCCIYFRSKIYCLIHVCTHTRSIYLLNERQKSHIMSSDKQSCILPFGSVCLPLPSPIYYTYPYFLCPRLSVLTSLSFGFSRPSCTLLVTHPPSRRHGLDQRSKAKLGAQKIRMVLTEMGPHSPWNV